MFLEVALIIIIIEIENDKFSFLITFRNFKLSELILS